MRMWMVNPKIMCKNHLLGEHREIHTFIGTLKRNISINGYINNDLLEPISIYNRHEELVREMKRRGYNHNSDLNPDEAFQYIKDLSRNNLYPVVDLDDILCSAST